MADGGIVRLPEIVIGGPKLPTAPDSLGTGRGTQAGDSLSTDPNDHGADPQAESQKGPKPAAADPAPPIGLRDSHKGKVIAIAPDVKYVGARGQSPTPFITRAYTDDKPEHYSPDVRYEGDRAMRFDSDVSTTYGGQAGTGRGVKSDTYMDRTFPRTHSDNVLINGSPAMRKGDLFDHNGSSPQDANTVAKAQHPGPQDAKPAPEKTDWWGRQFNRAFATVNLSFDAVEGVTAGGLIVSGVGESTTGLGALAGVPSIIGGVALGANAGDDAWANLKTLWTGEPHETGLQQGVGAAAKDLGASEGTAETLKEGAGITQGLVGPGVAVKLAREARAAKLARQAVTDGQGGVRVARSALRLEYEEKVRNVKKVADEMRAEGKSSEEIARKVSQMRRDLGEEYKNLSSPEDLEKIYARNLEKYGDPLGPSADSLYKMCRLILVFISLER